MKQIFFTIDIQMLITSGITLLIHRKIIFLTFV
jgi:hypothetical protein